MPPLVELVRFYFIHHSVFSARRTQWCDLGLNGSKISLCVQADDLCILLNPHIFDCIIFDICLSEPVLVTCPFLEGFSFIVE